MSFQKITLTLFILLLACNGGAILGDQLTIGLVISDERRGDLDVEILNAATDAFFKTQRFRMMERERLAKIIEEKGLQEFISALTAGGSSSGLEELEGVEMIGLVSYTTERPATGGYHYYISVRLVSVRTGQILHILDSRRAGLYEPSTTNQASNYLFQNVRETFPPQEYIIQLNGTTAVVGMGTGVGLKNGDVLEVIREGEIIFHPVTGKALPGEEIVIGKLKVTRASDQTSSCKVDNDSGALQVGDTVRLKSQNQVGFKVLKKAKKFWKRSR